MLFYKAKLTNSFNEEGFLSFWGHVGVEAIFFSFDLIFGLFDAILLHKSAYKKDFGENREMAKLNSLTSYEEFHTILEAFSEKVTSKFSVLTHDIGKE